MYYIYTPAAFVTNNVSNRDKYKCRFETLPECTDWFNDQGLKIVSITEFRVGQRKGDMKAVEYVIECSEFEGTDPVWFYIKNKMT